MRDTVIKMSWNIKDFHTECHNLLSGIVNSIVITFTVPTAKYLFFTKCQENFALIHLIVCYRILKEIAPMHLSFVAYFIRY